MKYTNDQYHVLHDDGRPLCFVGDTLYNHLLYNHFKNLRPCLALRLEKVNADIVAQYQLMCAVSTVKFKYQVADYLSRFDVHYFSVIGANNTFAQTDIGYNTYIQHYNIGVCDNISIGNHCTVTAHCTFSHRSMINDYCHISPYCFVNFASVGEGTALGVNTTIMGKGDPLTIIDVPRHCNFLIGSTVRQTLIQIGTYHSHRLMSSKTSLDYTFL
jgi:acetyltransferase-like isoleucine patch superfamily enzyme